MDAPGEVSIIVDVGGKLIVADLGGKASGGLVSMERIVIVTVFGKVEAAWRRHTKGVSSRYLDQSLI